MSTSHFGRYEPKFNGNTTYTLTTSYVASEAMRAAFGKNITVFPYYTPGAGGTGNTLQFEVEINPYSAEEDPANLYWSQAGRYENTAGTWVEEPAMFTGLAGTATVQKNLVVMDGIYLAASQVRLKAKETVVGGAAGTVKFVVTTNTIN